MTASIAGAVAFDPSLPVEDVRATINTTAFAFTRTLSIAGRSANLGVQLPVGRGAQTAVADGAGVRSQLAQWVNAGVVVVVLVFLSGAIAKLPQPALAALVVARALHMIEPKTFRAIARVRRDEWAWAIVTVVGVVLIGTLDGILIAVAISIATLFYQSSHPPVYAVAYNRALESLPKRRAARHRRGLPRSADVAHRRPAGVPNPGPRPRRIYAPAVPTSTVRRQCPSPARLTAQNTWPMPKYHRRLPP